MPMSILHLLVGRGGSKGIPGKNLQQIEGLSLIGYKAVAARRSKSFQRLLVSSDDPDIRAEAARWGAEVAFDRPPHLATDTATSADVILHAMDWIEQNEDRTYDAIMLLEPSSPFATPAHLDAAVELFDARQADLVVGMRAMDVHSRFVGGVDGSGSIAQIVQNVVSGTHLRRQEQPVEATMNGAMYVIRWNAIRATRQIYSTPATSFGLMMPRENSIEIDEPIDLVVARAVAAQGLIDISHWEQNLAQSTA